MTLGVHMLTTKFNVYCHNLTIEYSVLTRMYLSRRKYQRASHKQHELIAEDCCCCCQLSALHLARLIVLSIHKISAESGGEKSN